MPMDDAGTGNPFLARKKALVSQLLLFIEKVICAMYIPCISEIKQIFFLCIGFDLLCCKGFSLLVNFKELLKEKILLIIFFLYFVVGFRKKGTLQKKIKKN